MEDEIKKVDKWFKLANYISVAQMYLDDNIFLEKKIEEKHLKKYVAGHWGVSPSVNFVYAHMLNYAKKRNKNIQLVIGEGHAGSALLANLYIQKEISKRYDKYPYNFNGLIKLIKEFGTKEGFRTEINPSYPHTIYDGGELGYSLSVAIGASINNKKLFIPCIIGDGEAETGTIASSWNLNKLINSNNNGYVLPILNLNGFKMGSKSIFSTFSDKELQMYFEAMKYKVYIVHESHEEMIQALDEINEKEKNSIIILKTKKGWTAVEDDRIKIEGYKESHKNPLAKIKDIETKAEYVEKWLKSYDVTNLISKEKFIDKDIIDLIPCKKEELNNQEPKPYVLDLAKYETMEEKNSNINAVEEYLIDRVKIDKDFMIFSPDELESNFLGKLLENNETKNNVVEILNENICQALLQGHINSGKNGIMVSYEAFMPIITSMLAQYEKYIYQNNKVSWRKPLNSITYLLTSVCWENNYSHQNPEFISSALGKEFDFVNVYMPMDANSLLVTLDKCINEKNKINIIDISKRVKKQYKTLEEAKISIKQGIEIFSETDEEKADVILVAIGDYLIEEVIEAKQILEKNGVATRIVYISKINVLKELNEEGLKKYFGKKELIYVATHTYPSIIKSLMFRLKDRNIIVNGYKDKSDIAGDYKVKLEKNDVIGTKIAETIEQNLKEVL